MSKEWKSPKRGANILCRIKNPNPQNVVELVRMLPKRVMPKDEFATIITKVDDKWFQNTHQAAEQWGLYYVDNDNYYPRFTKDIDADEAEAYLRYWIKKYPLINPYSRFSKSDDRSLVLSIAEYLENHPGVHDLKTIITALLGPDEHVVVNDIVANAINNYSAILDVTTVKAASEQFNVYLKPDYKEKLQYIRSMDKREFFHLFDGGTPSDPTTKIEPKQVILFGAPGTGKSHRLKSPDYGLTRDNSIRITFHPDSDYASFVGCYKPRKIKDDLTYEFVPQAFTKAYVKAWKLWSQAKAEGIVAPPYTLVIEEINRGNCAQIFGDLFQLLDRNDDGYSDYEIIPDTDLQEYLAGQFDGYANLDDKIMKGEIMVLPPNLWIVATMNTSDQSLFPIDSAFKRRWDWEYIPIDLTDRGHYIACGDKKYSWSDFLDNVNKRIDAITHSEDKKLGYWFVARNGHDEITLNKFVSKVVFYLWNDIFKDFTHDVNTIFKDNYDQFYRFFENDGTPKIDVVESFLENLGLKAKDGE